MSEWKIRPYQASDESGVTFLWLNSWLCGPFGRCIGAMRRDENGDMRKVPDAFRFAWTMYQPVVERLVLGSTTTVLCDPEAEDVIWAFACRGAGLIHMAVIKRRFSEFAVPMLADLLPGSAYAKYTHECPDVPAAMRAGWTYDRELLIPLLARSGT